MFVQSEIKLTEEMTKQAHTLMGASTLFMTLGSILMFAVLTLGILFLVTVIAPGITQRCSATLEKKSLFSFAFGALVMTLIVSFLTVTKGHHLPALVGVITGSTLLLLGWTAAAEDLGRRLALVSGREGSRATRMITGWLVFVSASAIPIVGWFVILPYITLSGVGSVILAPFHRSQSNKKQD